MNNSTQAQTTLAPIIAFVAGLLAGKQLFGFDTATWTALITGGVGFATVIWSAIVTRKTAMITNVANMPEVKSIQLEPSAPSNISANTPNNVKV